MNFEKLQVELAALNEPKFRFRQIYRAVFVDLVEKWEEVTVLPKALRQNLEKNIPLTSLKLVKLVESKYKDVYKALFELEDKNQIETVLLISKKTQTVCISSQVGCAMGCAFCATGQHGFKRNLSSQEIFDQVLWFARFLKRRDSSKITNVVFMGMGEPFLNYENVMKAVRTLNDDQGFNFGQRRISISTCGIIPGIKKFMDEDLEVNLAISLHAPDDFTRSKLMVINKKYPLENLLSVCRDYAKRTKRKVFFEYVLLKNINDHRAQARELAKILEYPLFHINLIKYNETDSKFTPSERDSIFAFEEELRKAGANFTLRRSLGGEIWAGCGQLKSQK